MEVMGRGPAAPRITPMLQNLSTLGDLLLVILGFGFIVFVHELGHFLAARWAGIRTLAFAIGFGPALLSFRKGMGVRAGSGEKEYIERIKRDPAEFHALATTEYRLNLLPLGGYVKMLGQEDVNPGAVSDAPDSYQNCKPWKRMVVISAGVIMNVITAAILFIVVFMAGLPVEPAKVGSVLPGSPAATTPAVNAQDAGVSYPGLLPGDEMLSVNGHTPHSFNYLQLETAMSGPEEDVAVTVRRPGVPTPLHFRLRPEVGTLTGLRELGVGPSLSAALPEATSPEEAAAYAKRYDAVGLKGVRAGMRLVRVGDTEPVRDGNQFTDAARRSRGDPFEADFEGDGARVTVIIEPVPVFEVDFLPRPNNQVAPVEHLLGLMPLMTVRTAHPDPENPRNHGLQDGDLFARIGSVEYPSLEQGMAEIKAHARRDIPLTVIRKDEHGVPRPVKLTASVNRKGQIGFGVGSLTSEPLVALPFETLRRPGEKDTFTPAAHGVVLSPGTRIVGVNDRDVVDFATLRSALIAATRESGDAGAVVNLRVQRPSHGVLDAKAPVETVAWQVPAGDVSRLAALGWQAPVSLAFEPEQTLRKAGTPVEAIQMGLAETRRVMLTTYITFARLAQGTVKVEHLKGPVGIAHIGTLIADRGLTSLLFFMALISVNLAVINFLPLPIVDGGQFLFLVYEQLRGRPVPMGVQNAVTMAGLVLIASMFLIVTYNDITNLIGL
jgi:regulator of sigma E protease